MPVVALALALAAAVLWPIVARMLEMRTYKLSYPDEIKRYSEEFSLDPYRVAAIIHCESGNRPTIISRAGAVGLMQVKPDTGAWIGEKLGIEGIDEERLKDPALNIRLGCWYFRFLLERYDQNMDNALAAYNAGQGNVDKWLRDPAITVDGVLTNIPFPETEEYIPKVNRAYEKYESLYADAFK